MVKELWCNASAFGKAICAPQDAVNSQPDFWAFYGMLLAQGDITVK